MEEEENMFTERKKAENMQHFVFSLSQKSRQFYNDE